MMSVEQWVQRVTVDTKVIAEFQHHEGYMG
jgi:hypothetical protein